MKARVVFIMGMLLALVGHGAYAQQIGDVLKGLQKGVGGGSTVSDTDIVNGLKEALQMVSSSTAENRPRSTPISAPTT